MQAATIAAGSGERHSSGDGRDLIYGGDVDQGEGGRHGVGVKEMI